MKTSILFFGFFLLFTFFSCGQSGSLERAEFIQIEGIDQYITIKGDDASKPVILFLHGGPGSVFSPYADAVFNGWEKEFVLVHWDQRGAGKTYGTYAPAELDPEFLESHPLTLDQMVKDGIALSEFLIKELGKDKIILFGTSWGSVLGAKMASERPDLFHAYIGHSQLVNPLENNISIYNKLLQLVQEKNDKESLQILNSLGAPPYEEARKMGQFIRVIKKYERMQSDPFPATWAELPLEYNNATDAQNRADGDDYSFLSYAGDKRFGVEPMAETINLLRDNYIFTIPVFFIQGEQDILTPKEINTGYYDKIEAPNKNMFVVPNAAHGFTPAVVDTLYKVVKDHVLPGIEKN